jgi:hypothetical protein
MAVNVRPDLKWHGGDPSAASACTNREQALELMRRDRHEATIRRT